MRGYGLQFSRNTSYIRPTTDGTINMNIGTDGKQWNTLAFDATAYQFSSNGVRRVTVDSSGNVGIGTTNPSQILHLQSASATGAIINLETTHPGGIPIYNLKGAHSAQLRYQDENGVNHSRIDFTDSGSFSFIDATNGTSHLYIAPTTGNATFAGDVTITGGDLTLGTDSIASNINAVGDVLAFKVDSNENTGGTPNIQFKVGAATELTIDGSTATFAGDIDLTAGQLELRGDVALDHDGNALYVKAPSSIFFYPGNSNKANINSSGNFTLAGNLDINGTGTSTIAGDLTVDGKVTAQEFHTEFVSASIIYQSGSTKFGDTSDDVHSFSGSLRVTGSGDHYFTDGNVGIGTTSPGTVLDIHGEGNVLHVGTGTNTAQYMSFRGSGASGAYIGYDGTGMLLQPGDGKRFLIRAGHATFGSGTTALAVDTSGNVGIGTTSPGEKLHVEGSIRASGNIGVTQTDGDYLARLYQSSADGFLELYTGESTPVSRVKIAAYGNSYINPSGGGRVGIGTTSPASPLSVEFSDSGTTQASFKGLILANSSATTNNGAVIAFPYAGSSSNSFARIGAIHTDRTGGSESTDLFFGTLHSGAYSEKMRIDSSGDVNIYGTDNRPLAITSFDTVSAGAGWDLDATSGNGVVTVSTGGTERMRIDSSGNVLMGTTNTTWQTVAGLRYFNGSSLTVTRDGGESLNLNRLSSNGDIAVFRKDSTAVGSISADADGLGIGSTDVGLLFLTVGQDRIIPRKVSTTAVSNNLIDLGDAGSQFKDLYLGGHAKIATALTASGLIYPTSDGSVNQVIGTDGNGNLSFITPGAATAFPYTGNAVITGSLIVSASGATNDLQIGDGKLFVSASGNVGIGTTDPRNTLHVPTQGNSNRGTILMGATGNGTAKWSYLAGTHYNQDTGTGNGVGSAGIALIGGLSGDVFNRVYIGGGAYEINPATEILFHTYTSTVHNLGGTERMRIDSSGNVGIGTSSPTTPLQVGDFGDAARAATFHGGSILLDGGAASEIIIGDGNVAYMSIQTTDDATAMNIRNFSGNSDLVTIERASGNVGIGTVSPQAILNNFSTSARGIAIENGYPMIALSDTGNSSFKSYIGTDSGELYVWNAATGPTVFATNNTERMRIDSSGDLLVGKTASGLATTGFQAIKSGQSAFVSDGDRSLILNRKTSDGSILEFRKDESTVGSIGSNTTAGNPLLDIFAESHARIVVNNDTSAIEAVRITDTGNVGIGTTSPSNPLDVEGKIGVQRVGVPGTIATRELTGAGHTLNAPSGYHALIINRGGSEYMRVTGDGNVGIGTSSPGGILDVQDSTTGNMLARVWNTNSSGTGAAVLRIANSGNNANGNRIEFSDANYYTATISGDRNQGIVFRTSATGTNPVTLPERMRIDSSGNVGIGISTPSERLHVSGAVIIDGATGDSSTDSVLYVTKANNNDWTIYANASGLDYGIYTRVAPTANYAIGVHDGTGFVHRVTGAGDAFFSGDLTVDGIVTAQEFHTEFVSASIVYQSGSTKFGDTSDDVHSFSGSLRVTGSGDHYFTDGNVGIGTTSPDHSLQVQSSGNAEIQAQRTSGAGVLIQAQSAAGVVGTNTNHRLDLKTNGGTRATITTAGNVGIGTTSPSNPLHVSANSTGIAVSYFNNTDTANGNGILVRGGGSNAGKYIASFQDAAANTRMHILANGNVGIGTTSPSEKLEVAGNAILDASNANLKIKAGVTGTKGDIQWTFNSDSTVYASAGIEYDNRGTDGFLIDSGYPITLDYASSYIRFSNNGSEKMRLNTSGNLGIGTTNPGAKLHVVQSSEAEGLRIDGASSGFALIVQGGTSYKTSMRNATVGNSYGGNTPPANGLLVEGNVGIGTTSPTSKLQVAGTIDVNTASSGLPTIKLTHTNSSADNFEIKAGITGVANSGFSIRDTDASANRFVIDSSGNVGIGVTDPSVELEVGGSSNTQVLISTTVNTGNSQLYFGDSDSDTAGVILYRHNGDSMAFEVNDAERMRIDSSGNVLVGKTASDLGATAGIELNGQYDVGYFTRSAEKALVVNRLSTDGTIAEFRKDGTKVGSIGTVVSRLFIGNDDTFITFQGSTDTIYPATSTGAGRDNAIDLGNSSTRFKDLYLSGTATVTALVETSTRELKENIETLEDQSTIVDSLQPVSYTWKEDGKEDFGLIAEDVEEIAPHLVHRNEDGKPTGIKYSKLSVLLLDVVQKQNTLINDLNERITKLENERG
jgi:fibronectin-binding autotransporter adhesin